MSYRPLAGLATLLLPLTVFAQNAPGPCRADIGQFCAAAGTDRKAAQACLIDHQKDISDACYEHLRQRLSQPPPKAAGDRQDAGRQGGPAGGPAFEACRQDIAQRCAGIEPGGGRLVSCLVDHQNEISDACHAEVARRMKRRQ